jgi:vacuolar protein sorting-associated protein 3
MDRRDQEGVPSSRTRPRTSTDTGPYVFRSLLPDVPLSVDGDRDDIEINCVEFLGMCRYIMHLLRAHESTFSGAYDG